MCQGHTALLLAIARSDGLLISGVWGRGRDGVSVNENPNVLLFGGSCGFVFCLQLIERALRRENTSLQGF